MIISLGQTESQTSSCLWINRFGQMFQICCLSLCAFDKFINKGVINMTHLLIDHLALKAGRIGFLEPVRRWKIRTLLFDDILMKKTLVCGLLDWTILSSFFWLLIWSNWESVYGKSSLCRWYLCVVVAGYRGKSKDTKLPLVSLLYFPELSAGQVW